MPLFDTSIEELEEIATEVSRVQFAFDVEDTRRGYIRLLHQRLKAVIVDLQTAMPPTTGEKQL